MSSFWHDHSCRVRAAEEGWSFAKLATQAYMDRVDLSAHGFYATPEITGAGRLARQGCAWQGLALSSGRCPMYVCKQHTQLIHCLYIVGISRPEDSSHGVDCIGVGCLKLAQSL